ncbi:MAG: hypothetical protein AB7K71_23580 [Polyangiaceae bacterium]
MNATKAEQKDRRFERWLSLIGERLKDHAWDVSTFYEDATRGNLLVLSAKDEAGLVELHVHRSTKGPTPTGQRAPQDEQQRNVAATLLLFTESQGAIAGFSKLISGLHRNLPRHHNAKRKFVHRVEDMARHLDETYGVRKKQFPADDFGKYKQWLADASPMVGVQASFRQRAKEKEQDGSWWDPSQWFESDQKKLARVAKRFPSRFAAGVRARGRKRAALYQNGAFALGGVLLTGAVLAQLAQDPGALERIREDASNYVNNDLDISVEGALDVAEFAYDIGELAGEVASSGAGDCGGIDLPDCGGIDLPDCGGIDLPDCGGIDVPDCGGCDFG